MKQKQSHWKRFMTAEDQKSSVSEFEGILYKNKLRIISHILHIHILLWLLNKKYNITAFWLF